MRRVWFVVGWIFVVLAIIGTALPIVPTVPFLLVAAWAFARSSPRLKRRILRHPRYGPSVRAWQERGVVGPWAKAWAISAMSSGVVLSWWLGLPKEAVAAQAGVCLMVATFLLTRPSR